VRIYRRNLPHWRQEGATYFVTFRLGDSVPRKVLEQWEYEKQHWLHARGLPVIDGDWQSQVQNLTESDQEQFHRHFNRLFHAALDQGHGACYLKDERCFATVREKLLENDGESYHLGDFVVMPNHVHVLLVPSPGRELEWILKAIKGAASRQCNQHLGRSGPFWQPDSYDHIVRTLEQLVHFRQYIKDNPRKAGIELPKEAMYHAEWMDAWFS
jgi:REP element-mobilizing transposase RayT